MKGPDLLHRRSGRLVTRIGACFPGSHALLRGHDLHAELRDMDWLELYAFGITGRRFTPAELDLMHALWVVTSYPDARIWNNRVAALAGSARSTGALGIAAALAVSEANIYGFKPGVRAYNFLARAKGQIANGVPLAQIVEQEIRTHRGIGGYGRPLVAEDERIAPIMALAREKNLADGDYVRLAFDAEAEILRRRLRLKMNYAALTAAFLLDLGFSQREYYFFVFPIFLAGMTPCVIEAMERPEGTLFPTACVDIVYEGPPKRRWPRSTEIK